MIKGAPKGQEATAGVIHSRLRTQVNTQTSGIGSGSSRNMQGNRISMSYIINLILTSLPWK